MKDGRPISKGLALILLIGLTMSCQNMTDNANKGNAGLPRHVVVIGVDAMSPDGIRNANTPVMDGIMQKGAFTMNARGVLPTSSSTNWASMVSGAGPEQHGVTSNDWERDDFNIPAYSTGLENIFPTIFGTARQQRPEIEMGVVYTWSGFGRLIERSALNMDANEPTDDATITKAIEYISDKKPNFLFLHLDNVDHVGHEEGHKTSAYYASVTQVDEQIGKVIQATKDAGMFEETVFIISADHGGIGYGHGGETLDEIEIPFLIFGKGIKKEYLIKNPVYTYDNAATVALLLGLKQPEAWIGKALTSTFEGMPEPNTKEQRVLIANPIIYPKPNLYDVAGGLYVNKNPHVKMEGPKGAEVRFTIDGKVPNRHSNLYVKPIELSESAVVMAKAFKGEEQESRTTKAFFRMPKKDANNGIRFSYYEGKDWKYLPVFERLKALKRGVQYEFRINEINEREHQFGIRFTSKLQIDTPGNYRFYLNSDDGSKLYINDILVVDNDGGHGTIERSGTIKLPVGRHDIMVDYHNQAGGAWLDAWFKGPGIPKQIIPAHSLFLP